MEKVGILYICTGKYSVFWREFYSSVKKYFLPDAEKELFVWTDADEIFQDEKNDSSLHCFYQECEKWPYPTLNRFSFFLREEALLSKTDYLIFMNGNLRVDQEILSGEILPEKEEELFVTLHPGFYALPLEEFTYEDNPESLAYVKKGEGKHYFAGGFNGGRTEAYFRMIKTLHDRITEDLNNDIIAIWHDESHLNRYMIDQPEDKYRILCPSYLYPEGWSIPFEEKITVRNKDKYGGHDFLRNERKGPDIIKKIKKRLFSVRK